MGIRLRRIAAHASVFAALNFVGVPVAGAAEAPRRGSPRVSSVSGFTAEIGSSFSNLNKVTASPDASRSLFGTHQFVVSVGGRFGRFLPEIGVAPIARKGTDDTHRSRLWILHVPVVLLERNRTTWKAGGSLWLHTISGAGGNIFLNDGGGTSTFSKPGRTSTTRTFGIVGGLRTPMNFHDRIFLDADLNVLAPLSTRRSANLLVQVGWNL